MYERRKRQQVQNEYGEVIGYLETTSASDDIYVLDVDGYELAKVRSELAGRRHLLNAVFNANHYFGKPPGQRNRPRF